MIPPKRNSGRSWEASVVRENQSLATAGRAIVTRMATHHYGGIPSGDPKVDFIGALSDGRCVAFDAKSGTGRLTKEQRTFLAHLARMGAVAFVYSPGFVRMVGVDGELGEKIETDTWIEAIK